MQLREIQNIVDGTVIAYEKGLSYEIHSAFGSDLMSDVLAYVEEDTLLITGLVNQQVIRTAEMLDLKAILFVRGKVPCSQVIDMAEQKGILLMKTTKTLFSASGVLYAAGLNGIEIKEADRQ